MSILVDISGTRMALHAVANQAYNLAMGLQNAAPVQSTQTASGSVQYLLETSLHINKVSKIIEESELIDSSKKVL